MVLMLGGSAWMAVERARGEVEAAGRTLGRMIAQRVAQHDAHLTGLVALVQAAAPPPKEAIRQVGASILKFYPRIVRIDLADLRAQPSAAGATR